LPEASKPLARGRARNERRPLVWKAGYADPGGVEAGCSSACLAPPPGCFSSGDLSGGIARSSLSQPANRSDASGIPLRSSNETYNTTVPSVERNHLFAIVWPMVCCGLVMGQSASNRLLSINASSHRYGIPLQTHECSRHGHKEHDDKDCPDGTQEPQGQGLPTSSASEEQYPKHAM
jgi:hypothetical protein